MEFNEPQKLQSVPNTDQPSEQLLKKLGEVLYKLSNYNLHKN